MKKLLFSLAFILSALFSEAADYEIFDIDINVRLLEDGSADVTEYWQIDARSGTEWYLVKRNSASSV